MPSDSLRTSLVRYSSAAETLKSTGISNRLSMPKKVIKVLFRFGALYRSGQANLGFSRCQNLGILVMSNTQMWNFLKNQNSGPLT